MYAGVNSISNTEDGGYYYPQKMGPVIQAWYLTCKNRRRGRGGGAGARVQQAYSDAVQGRSTKAKSAGGENAGSQVGGHGEGEGRQGAEARWSQRVLAYECVHMCTLCTYTSYPCTFVHRSYRM